MFAGDGTAGPRARPGRGTAWALLAVLGAAACGGQTQLPPPRPLIVHTGARLAADPERMREVDGWIRDQLRNIDEDPSFLIRTVVTDSVHYLWEGLTIEGDTASIRVEGASPEARTPYTLYAHFHLMAQQGKLERWLPEAPDAEGFPLERAILKRISDSWLYGRSIFDAAPYGPLDELMYATEHGYLEAFILTARPEEFAHERGAFVEERPGGLEDYRAWFSETFGREPPGLRAEG